MMRCCSKDNIDTEKSKGGKAKIDRDLCHICPSKLSKRELEDLYFTLLSQNVQLKQRHKEQNEKMKQLTTKLQRTAETQKTYMGKDAKEKDCCLSTKATVQEQRNIIADLKRSNEYLKEQIKQLNMKLCSAKQFLGRSNQQISALKPNNRATSVHTVKTNSARHHSSTSALNPRKKEDEEVATTKRSETPTHKGDKNKSKENVEELIEMVMSENVTTACQCVELPGKPAPLSDAKQPKMRSSSFEQTNENKEKTRISTPRSECDENKCRSLMDEMKRHISSLQEELARTHSEYSARIGRLEEEVSMLHGENMVMRTEQAVRVGDGAERAKEAQEMRERLKVTQCECDKLTTQLKIAKAKVAEMETHVKMNELTSRTATDIEERMHQTPSKKLGLFKRSSKSLSCACDTEHPKTLHDTIQVDALKEPVDKLVECACGKELSVQKKTLQETIKGANLEEPVKCACEAKKLEKRPLSEAADTTEKQLLEPVVECECGIKKHKKPDKSLSPEVARSIEKQLLEPVVECKCERQGLKKHKWSFHKKDSKTEDREICCNCKRVLQQQSKSACKQHKCSTCEKIDKLSSSDLPTESTDDDLEAKVEKKRAPEKMEDSVKTVIPQPSKTKLPNENPPAKTEKSPETQKYSSTKTKESKNTREDSPTKTKESKNTRENSPTKTKESENTRDNSLTKTKESKNTREHSPTRNKESKKTRDNSPTKTEENKNTREHSPTKNKVNKITREDSTPKTLESNTTREDSPTMTKKSENTREDSPPKTKESKKTREDSPTKNKESKKTREDSPPKTKESKITREDSSPKTKDSEKTREDSPPKTIESNTTREDSPLKTKNIPKSENIPDYSPTQTKENPDTQEFSPITPNGNRNTEEFSSHKTKEELTTQKQAYPNIIESVLVEQKSKSSEKTIETRDQSTKTENNLKTQDRSKTPKSAKSSKSHEPKSSGPVKSKDSPKTQDSLKNIKSSGSPKTSPTNSKSRKTQDTRSPRASKDMSNRDESSPQKVSDLEIVANDDQLSPELKMEAGSLTALSEDPEEINQGKYANVNKNSKLTEPKNVKEDQAYTSDKKQPDYSGDFEHSQTDDKIIDQPDNATELAIDDLETTKKDEVETHPIDTQDSKQDDSGYTEPSRIEDKVEDVSEPSAETNPAKNYQEVRDTESLGTEDRKLKEAGENTCSACSNKPHDSSYPGKNITEDEMEHQSVLESSAKTKPANVFYEEVKEIESNGTKSIKTKKEGVKTCGACNKKPQDMSYPEKMSTEDENAQRLEESFDPATATSARDDLVQMNKSLMDRVRYLQGQVQALMSHVFSGKMEPLPSNELKDTPEPYVKQELNEDIKGVENNLNYDGEELQSTQQYETNTSECCGKNMLESEDEKLSQSEPENILNIKDSGKDYSRSPEDQHQQTSSPYDSKKDNKEDKIEKDPLNQTSSLNNNNNKISIARSDDKKCNKCENVLSSNSFNGTENKQNKNEDLRNTYDLVLSNEKDNLKKDKNGNRGIPISKFVNTQVSEILAKAVDNSDKNILKDHSPCQVNEANGKRKTKMSESSTAIADKNRSLVTVSKTPEDNNIPKTAEEAKKLLQNAEQAQKHLAADNKLQEGIKEIIKNAKSFDESEKNRILTMLSSAENKNGIKEQIHNQITESKSLPPSSIIPIPLKNEIEHLHEGNNTVKSNIVQPINPEKDIKSNDFKSTKEASGLPELPVNMDDDIRYFEKRYIKSDLDNKRESFQDGDSRNTVDVGHSSLLNYDEVEDSSTFGNPEDFKPYQNKFKKEDINDHQKSKNQNFYNDEFHLKENIPTPAKLSGPIISTNQTLKTINTDIALSNRNFQYVKENPPTSKEFLSMTDLATPGNLQFNKHALPTAKIIYSQNTKKMRKMNVVKCLCAKEDFVPEQVTGDLTLSNNLETATSSTVTAGRDISDVQRPTPFVRSQDIRQGTRIHSADVLPTHNVECPSRDNVLRYSTVDDPRDFETRVSERVKNGLLYDRPSKRVSIELGMHSLPSKRMSTDTQSTQSGRTENSPYKMFIHKKLSFDERNFPGMNSKSAELDNSGREQDTTPQPLAASSPVINAKLADKNILELQQSQGSKERRSQYEEEVQTDEPKTYTIECSVNLERPSRATSPVNTDQEISHMTDLPTENEATLSDQPEQISPGEDKTTSTVTTSTSPITLSQPTNVSEGEVPQLKIATSPIHSKSDYRESDMKRHQETPKQSTSRVESTLAAIEQELAQCRRLLLQNRMNEKSTEKMSAAVGPSPPSPTTSNISLRRAEGRPRIGNQQDTRIYFMLHIGTIVLSDEAVINTRKMSLVLTWQFYNQNVAMSPMRGGRVSHFDFSTEYDLKLSDDFLNYLKTTELPIKICDANHPEEPPLASAMLPLREALLHTNRRADLSLALMAGNRLTHAPSKIALGEEVGVLDLWCMLRAEPRLVPAINRAIAAPMRASVAPLMAERESNTPIMSQINEDDNEEIHLSADLDPVEIDKLLAAPTTSTVAKRNRLASRDFLKDGLRKSLLYEESRKAHENSECGARGFPPIACPDHPSPALTTEAGVERGAEWTQAGTTSGNSPANSYSVHRSTQTNENYTNEKKNYGYRDSSMFPTYNPMYNSMNQFSEASKVNDEESRTLVSFEEQWHDTRLPSSYVIDELPMSIKNSAEMRQAVQRRCSEDRSAEKTEKIEGSRQSGRLSFSQVSIHSLVGPRRRKKEAAARNMQGIFSSELSLRNLLAQTKEEPEREGQEFSDKFDVISQSRINYGKRPSKMKMPSNLEQQSPYDYGGFMEENMENLDISRIYKQTIDITILWLALNEECSAMSDPRIQSLYVAYRFLGHGGAELETPLSLPKPTQSHDKCYFNFKKSFYLKDYDVANLGRIAGCRSSTGTANEKDAVIFTVVSEPTEDPLGLNNCEDIGYAYLYFGDLLAYSAGSDTYTEVIPVRGVRDDIINGVLAVRVDGLDIVRKCQLLNSITDLHLRKAA